jgi:zinc protease
VVTRELARLVFPEGHPYYNYSVAERVDAINGINMNDIKSFYADKYNASNMILSVVGDISEGEIKAKFGRILKKLNPRSGAKLEVPVIPLVAAVQGTELVVSMPKKEQVEINLGHSSEISRTHPDFYSTLLANYSLGGRPLSSKLGLVVRDEHGLVYNIRSSFKASLGAGGFNISLGCNPANVDKAIRLTKEELVKFLKEGVNATDLEANKLYLAGSFAARNLASNEDLVDVLASMQLYDLGLDYIENYTDLINTITLDDVNRSARKYIHPDKLNTVIVGPYSK